ncbi:MAG: LysM peptidoglycan-binding domain-containing protein [Verrucomicrobiota bacterium]|nr:LysM peptidoglycan-binding domain-containing protein [Verrucomicrobiota bacterium]
MKFWVVILVPFLFWSGCSPDMDGNSKTATHSNFLKAKEKYGLMDYPGAVAEYEEALRDNPKLSQAHLELGLIYGDKLNDPVIAIYHFKKFKSVNPSSEKTQIVDELIVEAERRLYYDLAQNMPSPQFEIERLKSENASLRMELAGYRAGRSPQRSESQQITSPALVTSNPAKPPAPSSAEPIEKPTKIENTKTVSPSSKSGNDVVSVQPSSPVTLVENNPKPPSPPTVDPPTSNPPKRVVSSKSQSQNDGIFKDFSTSKQKNVAPTSSNNSNESHSHTIQSGETLRNISRKYYGTPEEWEKILKANPGLDPQNLKKGQKIQIPK